jgi:hypothetical protein
MHLTERLYLNRRCLPSLTLDARNRKETHDLEAFHRWMLLRRRSLPM